MRSKAVLVLTLLLVILQFPASSSDNRTHLSNTTTISTQAPDSEADAANGWNKTEAEENNGTKENDTSPNSPSSFWSSTTLTPLVRFQTTDRLGQFSSSVPTESTTPPLPPPSKSTNTKLIIFLILLAIVVLMLFLGCIHDMKNRESGQGSSVQRLLQGVRNRLGAAVGNLEDRLGISLRPGGKRGEEDDEEDEGQEEEEEQRIGGSCGSRNEENGHHREEYSDCSHDSSSTESDNLEERALNRQMEEEGRQSGNKDGDETSSASEGGQSAEEGESSGDEKRDPEEIELVKSVHEYDEKSDLCDVTVF
nr:uncharacterized protein LOC124065095 isoform X2 [Scatophagus argus]